MGWVLGVGGLLLSGSIVAYVWWESRSYRSLAKETKGLSRVNAELRAELATANHANAILASETKRERVRHAREIAAVNERLDRARRLIASHGGDDLLAERLRGLLSAVQASEPN